MKVRMKPWPMERIRMGYVGWFGDVERSLPTSRAGIEKKIDDMLGLCSVLEGRTHLRMRVLRHADRLAVRLLELQGRKSL